MKQYSDNIQYMKTFENNQVQPTKATGTFENLNKVTPLSKYCALIIFILLPFIGGYVGYVYAPVTIMEVEKVVTKEVFIEKPVETKAKTPNIIKEIESSYIYLPDAAGSIKEHLIFEGDITNDSVVISPNNNFIYFQGFPCSPRGGHCLGGMFVYDLVNEIAQPVVLKGDENARYNLEEDDSLAVWQSPILKYGIIKNWDKEGHLLFEIDYKGETHTYRSASAIEPWVLQYIGVAN